MKDADIIKAQEKCEDIRVIANELERELARNPPDKNRINNAASALALIAKSLASIAR